jgi:hypothetical protein
MAGLPLQGSAPPESRSAAAVTWGGVTSGQTDWWAIHRRKSRVGHKLRPPCGAALADDSYAT